MMRIVSVKYRNMSQEVTRIVFVKYRTISRLGLEWVGGGDEALGNRILV